MPAHMTAKIVIASAKRLMLVRHFWCMQQQNRGDQRAGVADADPPHEVDDREAPGDRDVDAPDADAHVEEPADRDDQHLQQREAGQEADPPAARVLVAEDDRRRWRRRRTTRSCLFCTSGCISGSSGSSAGEAGRVVPRSPLQAPFSVGTAGVRSSLLSQP